MPAQLSQLVLPLALVAIFWFFVIRPQQTRAREQREMQSRLAVGDEVMLHAGIFGTVAEVGDRIRIRLADGSELEVIPGAVGRVVAPADAEAPDTDEAQDSEEQAPESAE